LSHGLDYDGNSNTVLLSRWEFVYIVKWDYPQNLLLRLQAPDYGLDHPAATHAFPSTNTFGTAPNLFPAPRSGALLHSYLARNGARDSLTLERLQPSTLKPLWSIEGFDTAAGIAISPPMEDVVVVTNTTFDAPTWRSQLSAYSLADGSLRFAWPLEWSTPSYVAFSYEGTAHNSSTGAQRMCTSVSTWFSPNDDQRTGLTCMDPSTGRVTLNVTLKAEDEKSSRANLMVCRCYRHTCVEADLFEYETHRGIIRRSMRLGRCSRTRPQAICSPSTALTHRPPPPSRAPSPSRPGCCPAREIWCRCR
jgi:hypothetical protein